MSHEISVTENGVAEAMFANKPAWHNLGKTVVGAPTSDVAIREAHQDWTVGKRPVYRQLPTLIGQAPQFEQIATHVETVRNDTGAVLGLVGADYGIVQNIEAFRLLDSYSMDGLVRYESAITLRGGKQVVLLARLNGSREVQPGDDVDQYLMLMTAHDGSSALTILPTTVRVVCANTLRLALSSGQKDGIRIRHTSRVGERAATAMKVIAAVGKAFDDNLDIARGMVKKALSRQEFVAFLDEVVPMPDPTQTRAFTRAGDIRDGISAKFYRSPLNQIGTMTGSAWAALNSVTEYVDHTMKFRATDLDNASEVQLRNVLFGGGHALKQRALATATALSK